MNSVNEQIEKKTNKNGEIATEDELKLIKNSRVEKLQICKEMQVVNRIIIGTDMIYYTTNALLELIEFSQEKCIYGAIPYETKNDCYEIR
jgi:flagellar biosynthesis/type III secretory pathway chaperone